jgi:hypothetical protein
MTDEQRDYLGKIRTGWAATFFMGLEKATFVKVPAYTHQEEDDSEGRSGYGTGFTGISDEEVREHMKSLNASSRMGPLLGLCEPCRLKCSFRQAILKGKTVQPQELQDLAANVKAAADGGNQTELLKRHAHASAKLAVWSKLPGNADTLWCAAIHLTPPAFFGSDRKPTDYFRAICDNQFGFGWVLQKYPERLQSNSPESSRH